jgi:hypothetical protein
VKAPGIEVERGGGSALTRSKAPRRMGLASPGSGRLFPAAFPGWQDNKAVGEAVHPLIARFGSAPRSCATTALDPTRKRAGACRGPVCRPAKRATLAALLTCPRAAVQRRRQQKPLDWPVVASATGPDVKSRPALLWDGLLAVRFGERAIPCRFCLPWGKAAWPGASGRAASPLEAGPHFYALLRF